MLFYCMQHVTAVTCINSVAFEKSMLKTKPQEDLAESDLKFAKCECLYMRRTFVV